MATWLVDHGLQQQDKICIIGPTGPQWCIADMAGQLAGGVTLGAYPTLTAEQLAYVLDHADVKVAFVESASDIAKLQAIASRLKKLEHIVAWNVLPHEMRDGVTHWDELVATRPDPRRIEARTAQVQPDDTAIIVYTSGTTGPPKGAMITHRNIISVLAADEDNPFDRDDISFNFLPMAHVAERVLGFYGRLNTGITTYFASDISRVLDEIQEARPTVFGTVPRVFEKAYAKIMSQVEEAPPHRQKIFRWAEDIGRQCVQLWQQGQPIPRELEAQYRLADRLVFQRIRNAFGGRVRSFVTGAAPIAPHMLEFFWAAGFRIYEVYGMTEGTVVTHANRPGKVRLGSVGRTLAYAECRIADDGEILIRGSAVFRGYYKDPEATRETITDGWLHTGDIGTVDDDGYLFIRDRKKHIIITAGGKNLSPANIENEIKAADPIISQVHVHGDRRKYLVALLTIGPSEAIEWAHTKGLVDAIEQARMQSALEADPFARPEGLDRTMALVTEHEEMRSRVRNAIANANAKLARVETIKRVHLLNRELSVAEDEITPTLKAKRRVIEKKFHAIFDALYDDDPDGLIVESL